MYDSHDEESPPPPLEQQGGEQHEWYNSRFGIGKGTAGKSKYPSKAKQNRMRNTRNKDKDDDYNDNGGGGLKCGGLKDVVEEGGNYAMITTAGNFRSSTISALGMSSLFLDPKNVLDDLNKTANEYDEYEAQAIIVEEEEEARQQQQLQLQQQQQRKISSSSSSSSSNRNIKKKIIQGQIEREKELKELEDVVLNYKHDHKEQEEEEQRSRESSRDHQEQKQRGLLKIASSPISKQQSKSDDYDDDDDIEENNSSAVAVVGPVESKMMSRHTKKRIMEMKIYYTIGIIIFITMCILFAYGGYIIYRNKQS